MFIVLERLHALRDNLRQAVVSPLWVQWNESNNPESQRVQRACLDFSIWSDVHAIVSSLRPLFVLLRMTDMEGCTLGLLYHFMQKLRAELTNLNSIDVVRMEEIKSLVDTRWEWMRRPIHDMASLIHPLWHSTDLFNDNVLSEARDSYLSKVYSDEQHILIDGEITMYETRCGVAFSRAMSKRRDLCIKPIQWWNSYGYTTPHLTACALRLLSQDCSAGACERNWSAYSLIHTKIRNRLSMTQLERLVYCRANLRLVRNFSNLTGPRQILEGLMKSPENRECADCRSKFSWQELYTAADFGREKRAFRICAFDSSSEESEDSDGDEEEPLQQKSSPVFAFTKATLSSTEKKDMHPKFVEERVLQRTEELEQSLFELDRARILKVQEEIRMRRLSFEAAFQDEALRSAAALEQVENERDLKHELAKRTDKQYQRSIAEARDLHLSALQRDHEQRSQVEERKIKKEVAIEEARKREAIAREERERQEKARLEAEAKRKADALLAEKAAVESARRKQAEAALQRAEAEKRAREEAELKARESVASVAVKPSQFQSLSANSDGPKPKIAESAARLESARSQMFKTWQQACPDLSSNAALKKEFKGWERRIIKILQQVSVSQDQIRMKSMELLGIFRDPTINQPFVFTMFSSKLMSQCELQVAKLPSYAFALAQVVVNVSSQVPDVMVAVLAKLHEVCIFTVPKYYSYKKDNFEDDNMYYKKLGYIESDGKLESTDEYIARMKAYITFYAAITQADALNGQNPHGLKEAWAWCAHLLNTIPANRLSANALEAFLKVAGYRLYRVYSKAFMKMLQTIVSYFIENLKKQKENEHEMRAVVIQLETYLHTRQYLQEPDGHNIPSSDLSSTKKA